MKKFFRRGRHRFKNSILGKILLLFVIAWVVLNGAFILGTRHGFEAPTEVAIGRKLIRKYLSLIVSEIGSPPVLARVEAIEADLGVRIRVEDASERALIGANLDSAEELKGHQFRHNPWLLNIGRFRGKFFLVHKENGLRFIFLSNRRFLPEIRWEVIGGAITLMLALFFGMYRTIRRILRPVDDLMLATNKIAEGNWQHRVPIRGEDELARLAKSFNQMSERIATMLASREQLLLDVSHELRSPLARMRLALEFLPKGEAQSSIVDDIMELDRLTGQILESARINNFGSAELSDADVRGTINEVIEKVRPFGTAISCSLGPAPLMARISSDSLQTVLRNLLENAQKYSGGTAIDVTAKSADGKIQIVIRDHGPGINPAELPRVFEPFFRADRSRNRDTGGYGFGLHLCKRLMQSMGGDVSLRNHEGGGLEVTVILQGTAASS